MNTDSILMTEKDYLRLDNLMSSSASHDHEDLEIELSRATLISDDKVPADLLTMNSTVKYSDLSTQKESIVTVVYPTDDEPKNDSVSIFAPLGSALIGLRKGQEINWQFPSGKTKRLKVLEIIYQPESVGDWHL